MDDLGKLLFELAVNMNKAMAFGYQQQHDFEEKLRLEREIEQMDAESNARTGVKNDRV